MKKTMYTVLITMLALCFVLAVSCGGGAAPVKTETTEKTTQAPPPPVATTPTPAPTPAPVQQSDIILEGAQSYTVASGDTLSSVSRRFYSNDNYFPIIMLGSSGVVSDPDRIRPGARLTIPNLRRNLDDPGAKARIKNYFGEIATIYERRDRAHYAGELRRFANSL